MGGSQSFQENSSLKRGIQRLGIGEEGEKKDAFAEASFLLLQDKNPAAGLKT